LLDHLINFPPPALINGGDDDHGVHPQQRSPAHLRTHMFPADGNLACALFGKRARVFCCLTQVQSREQAHTGVTSPTRPMLCQLGNSYSAKYGPLPVLLLSDNLLVAQYAQKFVQTYGGRQPGCLR